MARIRSIKPEFWDDEAVGELPRDARLLFIASWNLVDDEGLLRWAPDYLKAHAFAYDADMTVAKTKRLMRAIEERGFVFVYSGGRTTQPVAFVVNFRRHQKINRPQPGKLPPPNIEHDDVIAMYGRRDRMRCGVCKEPITPTVPGGPNLFDASDEAYPVTSGRQLAVDLIVPRSKGGSDYPSNIHAVHVGCRGRSGGAQAGDSRNNGVNHSVNDARTDSLTEVEVEVEVEREVDMERDLSSSRDRFTSRGKPTDDDDGRRDTLEGAWQVLARRALTERNAGVVARGGQPVPAGPRAEAWLKQAAEGERSAFEEVAGAYLNDDPTLTPQRLAELLSPALVLDGIGSIDDDLWQLAKQGAELEREQARVNDEWRTVTSRGGSR
jgi:hypothetical protein